MKTLVIAILFLSAIGCSQEPPPNPRKALEKEFKTLWDARDWHAAVEKGQVLARKYPSSNAAWALDTHAQHLKHRLKEPKGTRKLLFEYAKSSDLVHLSDEELSAIIEKCRSYVASEVSKTTEIPRPYLIDEYSADSFIDAAGKMYVESTTDRVVRFRENATSQEFTALHLSYAILRSTSTREIDKVSCNLTNDGELMLPKI